MGLQSTLAAGQVAIIPTRSVTLNGQEQIGWWAIDPKTGNTVGRMGTGGGQALVEEVSEVVNIAFEDLDMVEYYGNLFRCIASGVAAPLAGREGPEVQVEFGRCVAAALCEIGFALTYEQVLEEKPLAHAVENIAAFQFGLGHPMLCHAIGGEGGEGGEGSGGE
jgi:hypothetical protein